MIYSIHILDGAARQPTGAVLEDTLPFTTLSVIEEQWGEARRRGNERLLRTGRADLAHHGHWRWDNNRKIVGVREGDHALIGIRVGDEWQGAMSIYTAPVPAHLWPRWRKVVRVGRPHAVYVDYIESAPWNYERFVEPDPPRFRGVGLQLMLEAVRVSLQLGHGGRVGLYSLPLSEPFYEKMGMSSLFVDSRRDSPTEGLRYYEFSPDAATTFLARHMRIRRA